jgi:predicted alpha/beta superfamily hydrolase
MIATRHLLQAALCGLVALASPASHAAAANASASASTPLAIGETFTLESKVLAETRRINVYLPPGYAKSDAKMPVLYMPDGGLGEDFLHVAGLVQVSVGSKTMRPFILVGIENTERRRDLTGPTENAKDKTIAPRVGGSAAFRKFIRDELMPEVKRRYRTTDETAIVGESLAGLFAVETFFLDPDLFDTYIAIDPSLWWNDRKLVDGAAASLYARPRRGKSLWFASSEEPGTQEPAQHLADVLQAESNSGVRWHYEKMPEEKHATIYHPAALKAFRTMFAPAPAAPAR